MSTTHPTITVCTSTRWSAREWHEYIRSAPNMAVAGDRMEEALRMGADFFAMERIQAGEATR